MDITLEAKKRDLGTKAVQVRKQGFVPGCVYGHDMDSTPIQVSYSKLQQILKKGALKLEVSIDGKKQLAAIEEVQRNPGDGKLVHISFHALKQNEKTWMHVPLHLEGESAGVKAGGVIAQQMNEVYVHGYPKDIPDELTIDVAALELHDSIHVKDLVGKYKFEFAQEDLEKTIVVCHFAKVQEIPEPEAELEAAEGEVVEMPTDGEAKPEEGKEGTPAPQEEKKAA